MKFHKSVTDRRLFGVCGGLAETFKVHSGLVRLGFVLLHVLTRMPFFLLYLVLAFALPYGSSVHTDREEEGFGGFSAPSGRTDYTPDAPPFDVSDARDVEIDRRN